MPKVERHAPGAFCWIELGATDPVAAKKFYMELFGWDADELPMPDGPPYTLLRLRGLDVGGLHKLMPEQLAQGVPPHWRTYIASANVDETAGKVTANGGKVILGPLDVMDIGRMIVFQDPEGVCAAAWQGIKHIGSGVADEPNARCWCELATRGMEAAKKFYGAVFGWDCHSAPMHSFEYTLIKNGAEQIGGMMEMTAEWGAIPPHWMVYFSVSDCDAAAAKTKELGGKALHGPFDAPGVGRIAVLQDPQGAVFSVIHLEGQAA